MPKRKLTKALILLLVAVLALSAAGAALAQSSVNYDLGCWSVVATGGGTRTSPDYRLNDTFGQFAPGRATSPNYTLNAGFQQDWRALSSNGSEPPVIGPDDTVVHLPLIQLTVKISRTCMW